MNPWYAMCILVGKDYTINLVEEQNMKSMTKTTFTLPVLLGAVLLISGPVFAEEPKAKETPAAEKSVKESAMEKTKQDKAKMDKRDIREESAASNKEKRMLDLKK